MSSDKVPTLDDGCYVLACTPYHTAQLNKDMQQNRQFVSMANTEELTNMLFKATGNNDMGRVSGYRGTISGFHIFETNSFGGGVAGTAGVQTETIAGGGKITRTAFAMGTGTIGWATAKPMEINEDPSNSYGLNRKFIWTSHEGSEALDVDPNINPPTTSDQQLRVYEVRMTDVEIS
ncbi:hypothetical protein JYQ62_22080 [Nostoc sp. UHCC 0702]|nr:hypothetical protein JYQ62_22080 [Nostoc sp. UHCC 0702]